MDNSPTDHFIFPRLPKGTPKKRYSRMSDSTVIVSYDLLWQESVHLVSNQYIIILRMADTHVFLMTYIYR